MKERLLSRLLRVALNNNGVKTSSVLLSLLKCKLFISLYYEIQILGKDKIEVNEQGPSSINR